MSLNEIRFKDQESQKPTDSIRKTRRRNSTFLLSSRFAQGVAAVRRNRKFLRSVNRSNTQTFYNDGCLQ
jgi:negative regulator of replication initiation